MTADKPLTETERVELRLIIGTVPDSVARANRLCAALGAQFAVESDRFYARRGKETLAEAMHLDTLCDRLERLEEP